MTDIDLERVLTQIERDRAETHKLVAEAGTLRLETWLYPLTVGAVLMGAATAVATAVAKLLI